MSDHARPLLERDVDPDPLRQFAIWFADAEASAVRLPEAAALATAAADGAPSLRMVLVKAFGEEGFSFYTNYSSRKARELRENPRAALLFNWDPLGRQVRIEGDVGRAGAEQTERYVRSRPRASQLSALASPQSEVIAGREELERRVSELQARLGSEEPPLPDGWGGFVLQPASFEFWQQREDRLHDRLRYRRAADGWLIERLAP
jgi:pyridoxamine 5'-phosphate oxidase